MLSGGEIEQLRASLLALRARLVGDSDVMASESLTGGEGSPSSMPQHLADKATDTSDQDFSLGRLEDAGNIIEQIDDALSSIEKGEYGKCEECGKPISFGRLKMRPYTAHCAACQQAIEKEGGKA